MSYHFIVNPEAGRGRGASAWRTVQTELSTNGIGHKVSLTRYPGHAAELIHQVAKDDTIVAIGGDGTIHEIVNALFSSKRRLSNLMDATPRLGWIPAGTGNDFARTLRIPTTPLGAWDVLHKGHTRQLDLGTVNGRVFLNVSGVGFDAKIARDVGQSRLPAIGPLPYLFTALRTLVSHRNPDLTIRLDGINLSQKVLLVAIGNCRYYGGGMMICPRAIEDDGLFDVCLAGNLSKAQVVRAIATSFYGKHLSVPHVSYHRGRLLTIDGPHDLPIHADGQIIGTLPARYEILPGALHLVCPPETSQEVVHSRRPTVRVGFGSDG